MPAAKPIEAKQDIGVNKPPPPKYINNSTFVG
jgi:hypothetical protein